MLLCASLAFGAPVFASAFTPHSAITSVNAAPGTVLYSDDFESDTIGSTPAGWTPDAGTTWSIQLDGAQVLAQTSSNYNNFYGIHAGSSTWTDYTLSASVKPGVNGTLQYHSSVRLDGRRQDNNNMYSMSVQNGNVWYLGKRVNGAFTTLAQGATSYNTTSWYTWTLSFSRDTISASINGATLASVTDRAFSSGNISFWTHSQSELDNVVVTALGGGSTPTPTSTTVVSPTPTATTNPTYSPTPTNAPTPTEPPTPTVTPPPSESGGARLAVGADSSGNVSVTGLDERQNGWQVIFNPSAGGAITSNSEINRGAYAELEAQNAKHGRLQLYVQTSSGVFLSNLDNRGAITVLRDSTELAGVQTVSTNTTYQLRWVATYYLWPDGEIYMAMTVTNIGTSALKLNPYHSMEVDFGGLSLPTFSDTVNRAWYVVSGAAFSPIPLSTFSKEAAQFGHVAPPDGPLTLGLLMDKYTAWSSQGIANGGGAETQNAYRAKDQWFGSLSQFSAGASATFQLLFDQRRNLTPAQSLSITADYHAPKVAVTLGALATTDTEPIATSLSNGYNRYTGAYVVKANQNRVTTRLDTASVKTRFAPRFKITGWMKAAPSVTWGDTLLREGTDYGYALDVAASTLYLQLNFDVVASSPGSGQRSNATLDIS